MTEHDPLLVALRFNERINTRDLVGLCALMTEDHVFIDSAEQRLEGRERAQEAWRGFFEAFTDYRNVFHVVLRKDDRVLIEGRSSCSVPALDGPALWSARIRGDRVAEWRVFDDTAQARAHLGLAARDAL